VILVSCRREFTSNHRFSDENQFRDYPNLSDLTRFQPLDAAAVAERLRGKHVGVLVHGFKNPISAVASSYKSIEDAMRKAGMLSEPFYSELVGFAWPGAVTALGFFAAIPFANNSSEYFFDLLKLLGTSAKTTDVQTHSLGARVALQAASAQDEVFVDNLMLTAPAVDNESLEPGQEFNGALDACNRCFVYHSKDDSVLKVYTVAALDRALGRKGPEHPDIIKNKCKNVYTIDCVKVVKKDHGGYRKTPVYFRHWKRVLSGEPLPRVDALVPEA
jgi:esterase/lipase superfamily enzyme